MHKHPEPTALSHPTKKPITLLAWSMFGLTALFYIYEYILRVLPGFMTSELMGTYHIRAATLGTIIGFYYYIYAPMQIPVGLLMDRYRPRYLLCLATLACALGGYLFVHTNSILLAETGRFLIGFGSAFAFVGLLKIATLWLPPNKLGMIAGLATTLGTLAAIFSDWTLPRLIQNHGWKHVSYNISYAGVLLAVLLFIFLRDKQQVHPQNAEPHTPTKLAHVWKNFTFTLKNPQMWFVGLVGCFLYIPTSAFAELWGIPFLEKVYHLSKLESGQVISMIFIGWAIGGPIVGLISDKIRSRRLPIILGSTLACVLLSTALYFPHLSILELSILLLIFGICSSVQVLVFAIACEMNASQFAGTAASVTNMFVMLGGALFQPLIGVLLDAGWNGQMLHGIHDYSINNYLWSMSVLPVGLFINILIGLFLLKDPASYRSADTLVSQAVSPTPKTSIV